MKAIATCSHVSWDEQPYQQDSETQKMTRVTARMKYEGAWQGDSQLDYLMAYTAAGPVYYVGLERFDGTLDGRKGTFVLQHEGVYQDNEAQISYKVVPGSGTGELEGLAGTGHYGVGHVKQWDANLEYALGA